MSKNISTVIQEMKQHRNSFMKKSTPYRQLNRAIKLLEKLEQIEQIVNRPRIFADEYFAVAREIKEVLENG